MIQKPLFWHQGLFLQPQHFQMLERSLQGALTPFSEYAAPSFWGIADLAISTTALSNRRFDLLRGIFLFPDGTYIEIPGNAVIMARSFNDEWVGTRNVYLGLKGWNDYGENVTVLTPNDDISAVTTRYCAADNPEEINDLHAGGPAGRVRRIAHVMKIIWESEIAQAGDYVTMPIAQLAKSGSDVRLSDDYIPPSLNISGPLLKLLAEVRDQVTSRSFQLEEYKKKRGVHSAEFGSRDMVYILALRTLARYAPLLHHFIETKNVHPWSVYGALRQLVGELSVFSERVNVLGEVGAGRCVVPPYDHGKLQCCFSAVQEMISHLLDELTAGADYIIRLNHDGSYYSADLRPSIFEGCYRFYLSFKTEESLEGVLQAVKTVVKVGSREGLQVIISRALPGITLERQTQIPKELPYRSNTTYFSVSRNCELWESVEKNRNMALYWNSAPQDLEIELMVVGRS
jgi:type VI secretion system protein ImpJ